MSVTALNSYRTARRTPEAICPEVGCGHRLYRPTADEADLEMTTHRLEVHASRKLRNSIAAELQEWQEWIGELPIRLVRQLVTERLAGRAGYTATVDEPLEGVAA